MKPLHLKLENIGPFVGIHTIDFSQLDEIFLISGKTGSGKSTILDALTYALYGSLPGARGKYDIRQFRSDFCAKTDTSYVDFTFKLQEGIYRIIRTLPIKRITRNKTITEDAEQVIFYKKTENEWTLIENQTNAANKAIQKILRLSIDEFSKIVLLPQGEFADFLRASSSERKPILEKLFPLSKYSEINTSIKNELNKKQAKYNLLTSQIDGLQTESIETDKQALVDQRDKANNLVNKCEKEAEKLTQKETKLLAMNEQYSDYNKILEQLTNLRAQEQSIYREREKLTTAKAASSMRAELQELANSRSDFTDAQKALEDCTISHTKTKKKRTDLEAQSTQIDTHRVEITEKKKQAENVQKAVAVKTDLLDAIQKEQKLVTSCETCKDTIKRTQEELVGCKKSLTETKNAEMQRNTTQEEEKLLQKAYELACWRKKVYELQQAQIKAQTDLDKQQNHTTNIALELEKVKKQRDDAENANKAFSIALTLEKDKPCPVCGSTSHPQIAQSITLSNDISTFISENEKSVSDAKEVLDSRKINLTSAKTRLEQHIELHPTEDYADFDFTECVTTEQKLAAIKVQIENLNKTAQKRDFFEREQEKIQTKLDIVNDNAKDEETKRELAKQTTKTKTLLLQELVGSNQIQINLNSLLHETMQLIEKLQTQIETYDKNVRQTQIEYAELKTRITERQTDLDIKKTHFLSAQKSFSQAIKQANANQTIHFDNEEQVQQAMKSAKKQQELEQTITTYDSQKADLTSRAKEKKSSLSDSREEIQNKLTDVQIAIEENKIVKTNAHIEFSKIISAIDQIDKNYEKIHSLQEKKAEVGKKLQIQIQLSKAISGDNPKKISLDAWILGLYLEKITQFASSRLERISDGRYTMRMCGNTEGGRGYKGLDLEICDAYTGKSRPCNTLSGGETFMASISLALAISDTVQSGKGGIQIDSLFIDEGFGSLDDSALEKALSILDELRNTRTIGLISHVGELHTKIPSCIEVRKEAIGSTIKIST